MNGINTPTNNAINSYRQACGSFNPAVFDTKSQVQQNSSKDAADIWKKKYDGFDSFASNNGNVKTAGKVQINFDCINGRYDGFVLGFTPAGCKSGGCADTDTAEFAKSQNEEEVKKAKELADAYAYFGRAAKYNGYTVVQSGSDKNLFSYSVLSGKKSIIMIDPEFMDKIKDDPEMLKRYADEIENMKKLDKIFERSCKQQGKTIVSRGWRIEKDGSISSWSVVKTVKKASKSNLERMREMQNKILKKKTQKKKEQAKLEEKRSKRKEEQLRLEGKRKSAAKENIKRKSKKTRVYEFNRIIPKSNTNKTITSISVSCGSSPSLLDTKA